MKIEGYAAHFGKRNANNETVSRNAFERVLNDYKAIGQYPFINFDHDPTLRLGRITEMKTDDTGLYVVAEIADDIIARYGLTPYITSGKVSSFSTEGYILDATTDDDNKGYTAHDFDIVAVALVAMPADIDADFRINHKARVLSYLGAEKESEKKDNKMNTNQIIFML